MNAFAWPRFVRVICTVLVVCCFYTDLTSGRSNKGQSTNVKCTTTSNRCCKLGRKAARHHLISPFYTCHYEALIAGLDHQTSVANRMRLAYRGRVKYTKTIARTTAFRSRLASCYLPRHKRCFESCCRFKRESMIKAAKHAELKMLKKHVQTTPTSQHLQTAPTTKHVSGKASAINGKSSVTTTSWNHVSTTPSTKHVGLDSNHIMVNNTETPKI